MGRLIVFPNITFIFVLNLKLTGWELNMKNHVQSVGRSILQLNRPSGRACHADLVGTNQNELKQKEPIMKKIYKLVKEYPGTAQIGLKKGSIVFNETGSGFYKSDEIGLYAVPNDWVEKNPEFWKEVLFITEDGVGICAGEACWYLLNRNSFKGGEFMLERRMCNGRAKEGKYYSTKLAAEEAMKEDKLFGLNTTTWSMFVHPMNRVEAISYGLGYSWFTSEFEREEYVRKYKKAYTEEEMFSFAKYVGSQLRATDPQGMFTDWKSINKK